MTRAVRGVCVTAEAECASVPRRDGLSMNSGLWAGEGRAGICVCVRVLAAELASFESVSQNILLQQHDTTHTPHTR